MTETTQETKKTISCKLHLVFYGKKGEKLQFTIEAEDDVDNHVYTKDQLAMDFMHNCNSHKRFMIGSTCISMEYFTLGTVEIING